MGANLDAMYLRTMSGLTSYKAPVRLVATTNHGRSGLAAIDSVTPAEGDRVLLAGQTDAKQNGIYYASAGTWTRALDMSKSSHLALGMMVPVLEGTVNALRWYQLTDPTTGTPQLNVTQLTFTRAGILTPAEMAALPALTGADYDATPETLALRDEDGDIEFRHVHCEQVLSDAGPLTLGAASTSYVACWEGVTEVCRVSDDGGTRTIAFQGAADARVSAGAGLALRCASGSAITLQEGTTPIVAFSDAGGVNTVAFPGTANVNVNGVLTIAPTTYFAVNAPQTFIDATTQTFRSTGGGTTYLVIPSAGTLVLPTIAAASVASPAAGGYALFFDSSNSDKLSKKSSGGTVTVIGTET